MYTMPNWLASKLWCALVVHLNYQIYEPFLLNVKMKNLSLALNKLGSFPKYLKWNQPSLSLLPWPLIIALWKSLGHNVMEVIRSHDMISQNSLTNRLDSIFSACHKLNLPTPTDDSVGHLHDTLNLSVDIEHHPTQGCCSNHTISHCICIKIAKYFSQLLICEHLAMPHLLKLFVIINASSLMWKLFD